MDMESGTSTPDTGSEIFDQALSINTHSFTKIFTDLLQRVTSVLPIFSQRSQAPSPEISPTSESNPAEPKSISGSNYNGGEVLVAAEKPPWSVEAAVERPMAPCSNMSYATMRSPLILDDQDRLNSTDPDIDDATTTTMLQSPSEDRNTISFQVILSQMLTHSIVVNLRKQDLGKTVLGVSVPVTTGLIIIYFSTQKSPPTIVRFTALAFSIGCTAIWNGLLLRETYPLTANFAEQIGIAIVFLGFHGLVGSFLPPKYLWVSGLLGGLTVFPFVLAALPPNTATAVTRGE